MVTFYQSFVFSILTTHGVIKGSFELERAL